MYPCFVIHISKLGPRRTRTHLQACHLWKEQSINYISSRQICSSPAHSTYNVPAAFLSCFLFPYYPLQVWTTFFIVTNHWLQAIQQQQRQQPCFFFVHALRCFMGREERNPASGFSFLLSPSALYRLLPLSPPKRHRTTVIIHAVCRIHSTVPTRWQRKLNTPLCRQERWTRGNWKRKPTEIVEEDEDIVRKEGREENVRGRRLEW